MMEKIRKRFNAMARTFLGDTTPYARGYRAALRDAFAAIQKIHKELS